MLSGHMKLSYFVLMAHIDVERIIEQSDRLGLEHLAGPTRGVQIDRVEIADLDGIEEAEERTLVIIDSAKAPSGFKIDIAIHQARAHGLSGLLFTADLDLPATARQLAETSSLPTLRAPSRKASDLAVEIDRMVSSSSSDILTRARHALAAARNAAALGSADRAAAVLAAASTSLGGSVVFESDPLVDWTDSTAVFIGEVPRGRLRFDPGGDNSTTALFSKVVDARPHRNDKEARGRGGRPDTSAPLNSDQIVADAAALALPGVASVFSRVKLHETQSRFAPRQSSGELIAQLIVSESSRVDSLANRAYQLGVPLQHVHCVSWLAFSHTNAHDENPSKALQSALELFALELFEQRTELWHIAFVHNDAFIVMTEEPNVGEIHRRLREASAAIADQAQLLGNGEWDVTLGIGTPQPGPEGLRRSAAEARVAAETAISSGRIGHIEVTDVTGLRRVLLDFYASPTSRELLADILSPLDEQGSDKAHTAVRTLLAYLGNRNSPTKAAADLSLHPNAVTYRIRNIEASLQLDLIDPDTRFAIELACRVRLLGRDSGDGD